MIRLNRSIYYSWLLITALLCISLLLARCEKGIAIENLKEYAEIQESILPENSGLLQPRELRLYITDIQNADPPPPPIDKSCDYYLKDNGSNMSGKIYSVYFNFDGDGKRPDLDKAVSKILDCASEISSSSEYSLRIVGYSDKYGRLSLIHI